MEKKHWKSDEPWKKHEPGARLNRKQKRLQTKSERERALTEKKCTQNVRVYPERNPLVDWLPPGYYKEFSIHLSIPVTEPEFLKRMGTAFPELPVISKKGGRS